jgi:hypothetical protein
VVAHRNEDIVLKAKEKALLVLDLDSIHKCLSMLHNVLKIPFLKEVQIPGPPSLLPIHERSPCNRLTWSRHSSPRGNLEDLRPPEQPLTGF